MTSQGREASWATLAGPSEISTSGYMFQIVSTYFKYFRYPTTYLKYLSCILKMFESIQKWYSQFLLISDVWFSSIGVDFHVMSSSSVVFGYSCAFTLFLFHIWRNKHIFFNVENDEILQRLIERLHWIMNRQLRRVQSSGTSQMFRLIINN